MCPDLADSRTAAQSQTGRLSLLWGTDATKRVVDSLHLLLRRFRFVVLFFYRRLSIDAPGKDKQFACRLHVMHGLLELGDNKGQIARLIDDGWLSATNTKTGVS